MRRLIAACLVVGAAALAVAGPAAADPAWAPAATAPIHPGVQTDTNGGQCTANFVFFDAANNVYIGQAAHCSGTDGNTATNGCEAGSLPHGTPVNVDGGTRPGTIVYSSWVTMQANGEADANTCQYNDFALIKLDPADYGKVNPSIPFWGGPTGFTDVTTTGAKVLSYGNSSLRLGITQLSPKEGVSLGQDGRRLDAPGLHRLARHPGRLRQRLHRPPGPRLRRAEHAAARPAGGRQRRQRPGAHAVLHGGQRRAGRDARARHRSIQGPTAPLTVSDPRRRGGYPGPPCRRCCSHP